MKIAILTVSDTRTAADDRSGDTAEELLKGGGHEIAARAIVKDVKGQITDQLRAWLGQVDVIVATGGTGVTPRDVTPEAMAPLVTKHIPGFGELFRWLSFDEIGTSTIQSRADAALCGDTFVFLLPGSPGGVRTAITKILLPQLDPATKPCNFAMLHPRIRGEREDP